MIDFINVDDVLSFKSQKVCIFGAGIAGSFFFSYLSYHGFNELFVADNDESKHGRINEMYSIGSVEDSICFGADKYLLGFLDNDEDRLSSVIESLIAKGVSSESIYCVKMNTHEISNHAACYLKAYLNSINPVCSDGKEAKRVVLVGNCFYESYKTRIMGGTIGAVNMQRILLGESLAGLKVECMVFPESSDHFFEEMFCKYSYICDSARFISEYVKSGDAVYITNDVFSACILGMLKQKYILIYHGQGDIVTDMNAFGADLSDYESSVFTWIESMAIANSTNTYFPSRGAKQHFLNTIQELISFDDTDPLYNSIYDFPEDSYEYCESDSLRFLSVGQMTKLKGIDQIPQFLERIHAITGKRIIWKVIANGELKEEVKSMMEKVSNASGGKDSIDFEIIDQPVEHQYVYKLLSESDIYLMLHRISIFDFATLEAMYMGKAIILSDIPGNDEFNISGNVMLVNENTSDNELLDLCHNHRIYGKKNRAVYDEHFSKERFVERYSKCVRKLIQSYSEGL